MLEKGNIIKALECCANAESCEGCPLDNYCGACIKLLMKRALTELKKKPEEAKKQPFVMVRKSARGYGKTRDLCLKLRSEARNEFTEELYEKLYTLPTIYNAHFRQLVDEVKQKLEDEDRA